MVVRTRILSAVAALALAAVIVVAPPVSAHHRAGPCDADRQADETIQHFMKRKIRCAVDLFGPVPGGADRAICIADRESGLIPTASSPTGLYLGLYQHSAAAWPDRYAKMDRPSLGTLQRCLERSDERDRDDPDGPRGRRLEGRRLAIRRLLSGSEAAHRAPLLPLDSPHGQDRETAHRGGTHRRGADRGASGASRGHVDARRCGRRREAARQGQADRSRTARHPDGRGLVRGDRPLRGPSRDRLRHGGQAPARRRHRDRLRHDRRAQGVRRLAGLHGVRRLDGRGPRAEGLQGDGPRAADRRAVHPDQRLGRGADPGGRRVARRLRLHLRAQRARLAA